MKIEINNQTTVTIGMVFVLLASECLLSVFHVNDIINISIDLALCIVFNIFNYRRFRHIQTKEDLQLANTRFAFALLFINLAFIVGIVGIVIR